MTINVDHLPGRARQQASYTTRGQILATDWQVLADTAHGLYRVVGHRTGGLTFDPYWRTTSSSYVTTGDNGTRLDAKQIWSRPIRKVRPTGGGTLVYMMQVEVFGRDFTLEATLQDNFSSAITTDTTSSSAVAFQQIVQTYDPASPSNLDLLTYGLQAKILEAEARVWQIAIDEYVLEVDAQIPRSFP